MTCSVSLSPLLLAATAIPALAATEVALTDDPTCEQWGTEAFFSAADATITAQCLEDVR